MRIGCCIPAFVTLRTIFLGTLAAPKVDHELSARLNSLGANAQLGVILTFQGTKVIDSQAAAVAKIMQ